VEDLYKTHFVRMAKYHHWAYAKLIKQLQAVNDTDYKKDIGLFFHSVHRTLNHLLVADKVWYGRFVGHPFLITGLDQELVEDRAELYKAVLEQAARWVEYVEGLTTQDLAGQFNYLDTKGKEYARERGMTLDHVFNHGTHHRGQISAAITQLAGANAFEQLDLLYFIPEFPDYVVSKSS